MIKTDIRLYLASFSCLLPLFLANCTNENRVKTIKQDAQPAQFQLQHKRYTSNVINGIAAVAWDNFHKQRYEQAALDFERLLKKKYFHYDTSFGAGLAFMKYYNLKKAEVFFSQTIRSNSKHFEALYFRALLNIELKNYTMARKDLEKILSLSGSFSFICGLYTQDLAGPKALEKRQKEALSLLKSL